MKNIFPENEKTGSDEASGTVTRLLIEWGGGDQEALTNLIPIVYGQLHKLAEQALNRQQQYTLQPTALVNEAFLRLVNIDAIDWKNRAHFFAVAATSMRQVLVDYARRNYAAKRGSGQLAITLKEAMRSNNGKDVDLIALDDALTSLAAIDPQQSHIVELRFFGGLTVEETAEHLGISPSTVTREWRTARAWLYNAIK